MLHEAIFLATCNATMTNKKPLKLQRGCHTQATCLSTCNATNVALQVARKHSRLTPHFATAIVAPRVAKKSRTTLYFSQRRKTSCLRVTPPLQLERFFIRHRCVARCKKNCFRVTWSLVPGNE